MQRNLEKLLNYDRFTEENMGGTLVEERVDVAEEVQTNITCSDEDTRPSSTTMQFADGEIEHVYSDMRRGMQEQKSSYRLRTFTYLCIEISNIQIEIFTDETTRCFKIIWWWREILIKPILAVDC